MKKYLQTLLPVCLLVSAPLAMADEKDSAWSFSGNVALTSDYVFRGISQTNEEPAIQGGFDVEHKGGFYAGTWASNVDFQDGDNAQVEIDLYGGYKFKIGKMIELDVGAIHYDYPGASNALNYDFEEVYIGATFNLNKAGNFNVKYSYANDFFGGSQSADYVEFNWDLTFKNGIGLAFHAAKSDGDAFKGGLASQFGTPDYTDYKLAISKEFKGFNFELAATDTNLSTTQCFNGGKICDSRVILTISRSM